MAESRMTFLGDKLLVNLNTGEPLPHRDLTDWNAPAVRSTVEFLQERYQNAKCDHYASSCCIRCNVMFLIHAIERAWKDRDRMAEVADA